MENQNTHPSASAMWERTLRHVLAAACDASDPKIYLQSQTPLLRRALSAEFFGLVARPRRGADWAWLTSTGTQVASSQCNLALLTERQESVTDRDWCFQPMTCDAFDRVWLVARFSASGEATENCPRLAEAAETLKLALELVRDRLDAQEKLRRQATLLRITQRWYQARQLRPLLNEIAQAAAEFLRADRATIFLWDRETHLLIGRPALGVDNELRIPDDAGIAGKVLHSGEVVRVGRDSPYIRMIDRRVDAKLEYRTETLICAPLRTRGGRVLGVFEVLNKKQGEFTERDEAALVELAEQAATALESVRDFEQVLLTRRQIVDEAAGRVQLVGQSPAIARLRQDIERLAATDLPVLLQGQNGTGKEVIAQMIHYLGPRREHPFVAVNCAAIPESLAESELFGHEKGAFTDAHQMRPGKFEIAQQGTVFLDEIAELSPAAQAKLLRVLEEKMIVRVGGTVPVPIQARVIAATNQDLQQRVRDGRFREDLFYRLNTVTLVLPPLRERGQDILLLADHFLRQFAAMARRPVPELTPAARDFLLHYPWPGNVRELRNLMERLVYLCPKDLIDVHDLGLSSETAAEHHATLISPGLKLRDATRRFQAEYILRTIEANQNNVTVAARQLGLHRANLYRKMRQLGIQLRRSPGEVNAQTGKNTSV